MRNFYQINGKYYINTKAYLDRLAHKLDIYSKDNELNKQKLQSLASLTQNLWKSFNEDRDTEKQVVKDKHYMDTPAGLRAYASSFLLPNIERIFSLLTADENIFTLKNLLLNPQEELVLADFGAGPLSATTGFLCALEYVLETFPQLCTPKKIKIYAIERSEKIYQYGLDLLNSSLLKPVEVSIERLTSIEKMPSYINISIAANVFNEIPLKHRLGNIQNLHEKLTNNGILLVLEPGQSMHAKALGTLRDEFLLNAQDVEIVSPCAHKKKCPLSATSTRSDWCWSRHHWQPPYILNEIDKFSKIDHHELNYSYVFFVKTKIKMVKPYFARIVSDKLENKAPQSISEFKVKYLLCTNEGKIEPALYKFPEEALHKRGEKI